ncbi:hypothetical protein C8R43DRAFT_1020766 [Mycena crocata]|nr:hypothetical protein C8R43DRAFT_1020766 [Mycena crocata]
MDVSGATEVPLDFFLNTILHSASHAAPRVTDFLTREGHIVNGRWKQFVGWDGHTAVRMSKVLEDFLQVFDVVSSASQRLLDRKPTVIFTHAESEEGVSRVPGAEFQTLDPDAKLPSSFCRAVPWELATLASSHDIPSIEDELVSSCHNVLRDDARRRFAFGVSTDYDSMRVWYFSRSYEFVTPPFSFVSEPRSLIHTLLALAFATPEALGYDTTMSCFVNDANTIQYRLIVDGETYVTKNMLSDNRADVTRGRVTRVWEAFREDDTDRIPVILKDVWALAEAIPEGEQLLDLRRQLQAIPVDDTPRPPTDYFLTVVAHGFVSTSYGAEDNSASVLQGCALLPPGVIHCSPRKHYRIVFREVGVALEELESIADVMRALADATQALRLLHRLGLVHRDVSAGNILLVKGVGKLSDLEYMLPFKGSRTNLAGRHIWPTTATCYLGFTSKPIVNLEDIPPPEPPFRFNPLHDLESLIWIGLFCMSYHRRCASPEMRFVFDRYFPRQFCDRTLAARMLAIRGRILPIPPSDPLFKVAEILDGVRALVFTHYAQFGKDFRDNYFEVESNDTDELNFGDLHATIYGIYEKALRESRDMLLAVPNTPKRKAPCDEIPAPQNSPRSASAPPPSKKFKSVSLKTKGCPTAGASGTRKRRSPNVAPSRRSLRIAEKKKRSKEGSKSWT